MALQCIQTLKTAFIQERQAHTQERQAHTHTEQERDQWRTNCLHMQEERDHWRSRYLRAEQQQAQENKFWQTPTFKPAEKLMIRELQRQVNDPNRQRDEEGFTQICYETAARRIGMSANTPKLKLQAVLNQCPDFPLETKEHLEPNPKGKGTIPRLYVKTTTNLIAATPALTLTEKIKQGGNQYQCQKCLSHNVMIERRLKCLNCGHTSELEPTFPNGKLKGAEAAKGDKTNLVVENHLGDRADSQEETGTSGRTNLVVESDELTPTEKIFSPDEQLVGVVLTSDPPLCIVFRHQDRSAYLTS
jgi:hypothetical protein